MYKKWNMHLNFDTQGASSDFEATVGDSNSCQIQFDSIIFEREQIDTSLYKVLLEFKDPNLKLTTDLATLDTDANKFKYIIPSSLLAVKGKVWLKVSIINVNSEFRLSDSKNFSFIVNSGNKDSEDITKDSSYLVLTKLIADVTSGYGDILELTSELGIKKVDADILLADLNASILASRNDKINLENAITIGTSVTAGIQGSVNTATSLQSSLNSTNNISSNLKGEIESAVASGNTIKTEVADKLLAAGISKAELDSSIGVASSTQANLDSTLTGAGSAKAGLDTSVAESIASKTALDITITESGTVKNNVDGLLVTGINAEASAQTAIGDAQIALDNAESKRVEVITVVDSAETKKQEVLAEITNAETKRQEVITTIDNANTSKTTLDSRIITADDKIASLEGYLSLTYTSGLTEPDQDKIDSMVTGEVYFRLHN